MNLSRWRGEKAAMNGVRVDRSPLLLATLATAAAMTRWEIADRSGIPMSLVNVLLTRARKKGLVVISRTRGKSPHGKSVRAYALKTVEPDGHGYVPRRYTEDVIFEPVARVKARSQGSGVIAPAPYFRGLVWGAGW